MGSFINKNLRFLRKKAGLTQEQFSAMLGIKRSLLGAYEEGRAEPNLTNLQRFAEVLSVSFEDLVARDLSAPKFTGNIKALNGSPRDEDGNALIPLVPQKAAAGYSSGYTDPDYLSSLPVLQLPMFRSGNFRAFELTGDSMLPLASGTIIVASYSDDINSVKDGTCCVVVTRDEGLVYKRVFNNLLQSGTFRLVSDNPAYEAYEVEAPDILELWIAKAYISLEIPSQVSIKKLQE